MKKEFKETTKFPRFIIVLFLFVFIGALIFGLNNQMGILFYCIFIIVLFTGVMVSLTKLKVKVTPNVIKYKIIPIFPLFIDGEIPMEEVKKLEVVSINYLNNFLGLGIRFSKKYGICYVTGTEYALFIETKSGKRKTLSISKKEELSNFLKNIENNTTLGFN